MNAPFVITRDAWVDQQIALFERGLDPARLIERAALPIVRGGNLMAMADIEKSIVNKPDWRRTRGVQTRDFAGSLTGWRAKP